jgi:hypothetical protein
MEVIKAMDLTNKAIQVTVVTINANNIQAPNHMVDITDIN